MSLTLILSIVLSSAVFAGIKDVSADKKENKLKVERQAGSRYELTYLTNGEGSVRVNIYDQEGTKLHSEVISNIKSFSKEYDFDKLPEGTYSFEIVDNSGVVSTEIKHIVRDKVKAQVKPIEDNKYQVLVRGNDFEPVIINIYDRSRNLIYSDVVKLGKSFTKTYDLSKVSANSFTFEVVEDGSLLSRKGF